MRAKTHTNIQTTQAVCFSLSLFAYTSVRFIHSRSVQIDSDASLRMTIFVLPVHKPFKSMWHHRNAHYYLKSHNIRYNVFLLCGCTHLVSIIQVSLYFIMLYHRVKLFTGFWPTTTTEKIQITKAIAKKMNACCFCVYVSLNESIWPTKWSKQ